MPLGPAGSNTPRLSTIYTNPTSVTWSDGLTFFDGFLWIGIGLPSGGQSAFQWVTPYMIALMRYQALPAFIKIPIVNGAIDQTTQLMWNQDINPPGTNYVAYWFATDGTLITPASGSATPFTISSLTTTINVPTLTIPSSPLDPIPQTGFTP